MQGHLSSWLMLVCLVFAHFPLSSQFSVSPMAFLQRQTRFKSVSPQVANKIRVARMHRPYCSPWFLASNVQQTNDVNHLPSYIEVGRALLHNGFYAGIIESIGDCLQYRRDGFMVLDSPSGSGKTQAGVALRQLDNSLTDNLASDPNISKLAPLSWRVAHVIWKNAVRSQDIYDEIISTQRYDGINSDWFFLQAETFAEKYRNVDIDTIPEIAIWRELLMPLFDEQPDSMPLKDFKRKHKLDVSNLVLFMDEVPNDPKEVQKLLIYREALRKVAGLAVIFAGTNAKVANVVSLARGFATSTVKDFVTKPWSLFVTRLPHFEVGFSSSLQNRWDAISKHVQTVNATPGAHAAFGAISCAISQGGNPRLINYGMSAYLEEMVNPGTFDFGQWQRKLSEKVVKNKFVVNSWSQARGGVLSQLNLLLEATCDGDLSDLALGSHFAFRKVPESNQRSFTGQSPTMRDCSGWLYIADPVNRILGNSLLYHEGAVVAELPGGSSADWQTTIFAPVHQDPLLHLSSCREGGYFTAVARQEDDSVVKLAAHQVVRGFWKKNIAGLVNFQNPNAPLNTGSELEVLGSVALCNAAAISSANVLSISEYLVNLVQELGIPCDPKQLNKVWSRDIAFKDVNVPRNVCTGSSLPQDLVGFVGLVTRQRNSKKVDAKLSYLQGRLDSLRTEMKDRVELGTDDVRAVVNNIVREAGALGIMIVRGCNQYWDEANAQTNFDSLQKLLGNSHVGKIYFVSKEGKFSFLPINQKRKGRVVLIQVPLSVLGRK